MEILLAIIVFGIGLWILWWFVITIQSQMALARNWDSAGWILAGILASPFLAIFLTWVIGSEPHPEGDEERTY